MGGQCSSAHFKQQFEIVKEYEHTTLGYIKVIRSIKSNFNNKTHAYIGTAGHNYEPKDGELIGIKEISFSTYKELEQYLKSVKQANLYYNIPTLLRILSYQINNGNGNDPSNLVSNSILRMRNSGNIGCGSSYSMNIYFNYYEFTLKQMLKEKRKQLSSLKINDKQKLKQSLNVKLNNYERIDKLPHHQRKLVNIYFQQVEILRMIDHIVGALYFLNHLQHKHESVCPQNILIDDEGKFILIDAIVFELDSNYEIALMEHINKNMSRGKQKSQSHKKRGISNRQGMKYLSPQLLAHIKNNHLEHHQSSEEAQVFSVGLIALDMCLLEYKILEPEPSTTQNEHLHRNILDKNNLKINKNELNKALIEARQRYSVELVDLLTSMLEFDPNKRINFSTLIDLLSPLLAQNLSQIQNLFNSNQANDLSMNSSIFKNESNNYNMSRSTNQLMIKLSQLQTNFQKIMNSRIVFEQETLKNGLSSSQNMQMIGQEAKKRLNQNFIIEDQKRILKQLKKINVISKSRTNNINKVNIIGGGESKNSRERREFKGSQLYDLYLSEYQTIKQNRLR